MSLEAWILFGAQFLLAVGMVVAFKKIIFYLVNMHTAERKEDNRIIREAIVQQGESSRLATYSLESVIREAHSMGTVNVFHGPGQVGDKQNVNDGIGQIGENKGEVR